ncbi:MAG: DUF4124 domain-containing protein [Pseudomonadota bacterium]
MRILLILCLVCLASATAFGDTYKWIDKNGNTVFGDTPPADAQGLERIGTPRLQNTLPAAKPLTTATPRAEQPRMPEVSDYRRLVITSPAQDEAVRSNSGDLTVSTQVEPALDVTSGHRMRVYLDGQEMTAVEASSVTLSNVERGTHSVRVEIIDANNTPLKSSETHTFHLLRAAKPIRR